MFCHILKLNQVEEILHHILAFRLEATPDRAGFMQHQSHEFGGPSCSEHSDLGGITMTCDPARAKNPNVGPS